VNSSAKNKNDKSTDLALARFAVIAPLVCRNLERPDRNAVRSEILKTCWEFPDGKRKLVAERTLRSWVASYIADGFAGLRTKSRSTKGLCRAISKATLDRAIELRLELPCRSTRAIVDILRKEGLTERISNSTLNRQLRMRGYSKTSLKDEAGVFQRWQQQTANDLWQCDTAVGPSIPDTRRSGRLLPTKLIIAIDDASRRCVHAQFYWDEKLPSVQQCLKFAIRNCGKPRRLLFDNGPAFRSNELAECFAELGIEISFCQPYSPSSKGKIERMIRSLKEDFYREIQHAPLNSIDDLNSALHQWILAYNARPHSGLRGATPLERWVRDSIHIIDIDESVLEGAFASRSQRTVHERTATVTIGNIAFQASPELAGQDIEVRWNRDSYDNAVELWQDGRFVETATKAKVEANVDFARRETMRVRSRRVAE